MHDPWIDRLSDYIDGALAPADAAALERHLAGCAECSTTLDELRAVVAAAAALKPSEPETDLWPGIAARIGAPQRGAWHAPVVRPLAAPPRRAARRFSFSSVQLAAAAVLLMALTGSAAYWMATQTNGTEAVSGTIVQSAATESRSTRTVGALPPAADAELPGELAELERALEENRTRLDPATVEVLERSIASIDRAIADARAALEADPGNPYLHRQLDSTMRKKIELLRRADRVQRGGS